MVPTPSRQIAPLPWSTRSTRGHLGTGAYWLHRWHHSKLANHHDRSQTQSITPTTCGHQTPSGSSDNKDSHISTMNSFSVPDNCSNTIFSRDWLPEIWNVMKFLPEPEVHQHNLDGDPMCGQLCRMTYWCGNETSFHNLTPQSDSEWEKTSSLFDRFPQFHVKSEQFLHTTFRIEPQPFLRESDSRNDSSSTQLCQLRMGYTFGCSIELSLPWSGTMAGSPRCPFLQSWQPLCPSPLGLLPHAQEQTDHRRLSSETNEILEGYGRHNEPTRIRVDGIHTTPTSRKQSGHSDKSPFQQGFSITRLPTSETPERPTPPDLSC